MRLILGLFFLLFCGCEIKFEKFPITECSIKPMPRSKNLNSFMYDPFENTELVTKCKF
jgi:hypothetical protein